MKERIFHTILLSIGGIGTPLLLWFGSPAQEYLTKVPLPLLIRILAVSALAVLLLSSYIILLKWRYKLKPTHGIFRDSRWNFYCPSWKSLLAYRTDTPKEQHHFQCHKCRSSRYPDNNMTKEELLSEKPQKA